MSVRPKRTTLEFLVPQVMDIAHEGLEEQDRKKNKANDGMVPGEETNLRRRLLSQPNTNSNCCRINKVGKELKQAVNEPCIAEGAEPYEDTASGEEDHESQRG